MARSISGASRNISLIVIMNCWIRNGLDPVKCSVNTIFSQFLTWYVHNLGGFFVTSSYSRGTMLMLLIRICCLVLIFKSFNYQERFWFLKSCWNHFRPFSFLIFLLKYHFHSISLKSSPIVSLKVIFIVIGWIIILISSKKKQNANTNIEDQF